MPLPVGVPAPWFNVASMGNPNFAFSSLGGRFILLAFLPTPECERRSALTLLSSLATCYSPQRLAAFAVSREAVNPVRGVEGPGLMWFFDADTQVSRLYQAVDGAGAERPHWLLIDPALRTLSSGAFSEAARLADLVRRLPSPDDHAGVTLHAPVLIVPRIFEPALCQRLICHYESAGGQPSGVMRDIGGRTVGVLDDFKCRRDAQIGDEGVRAELRSRIRHRLLPEIKKAFQFEVTRLERYIVACYDAGEGGYFKAHRDDTTLGTAHRRFACSINLNAEEHEGGDLRFPEFGSRSYRPPTGGAVVFSCSLLHEATPVTRGRRYAFLPFFYNEEAASLRAANLRHVASPASSEPEPEAP
jgi:predicted 2-oxoglutarate/Fe(II)-dependent dioxygenase YbiX